MGINNLLDSVIVQFFISVATLLHIKLFYIGFFLIIIAMAALNDILTGRFQTGIWGNYFYSLFTSQSDNIKNTFSFWIDLLIFIICGGVGVRLIIVGISLL